LKLCLGSNVVGNFFINTISPFYSVEKRSKIPGVKRGQFNFSLDLKKLRNSALFVASSTDSFEEAQIPARLGHVSDLARDDFFCDLGILAFQKIIPFLHHLLLPSFLDHCLHLRLLLEKLFAV